MRDNLPKGWELKKISSVSNIIRGLTFKPEQIKNVKTGIACFRTKNIQSVLDESDIIYIDKSIVKSQDKILRNGDILISSANSFELLGKCCLIENLNYEATLGGFICCARPNINIVNYKYFYHFFNSSNFQTVIRNFANQTTGIANLPIKKVESELIPIPPLSEQMQIVDVIDKTVDKINEAIFLVKKNIGKIKQLDESAFSQVFEKLLNDKVIKKRLVDIAEVKRGKSKHRPRNDKRLYDGDYPLIQTGDIRNAGKFITQFSQTYNETGLAQSKLWEKGTVCLTIAANIGDVAILGIDACFPDSVVGIHSKTEDNIYIYYFLKSIKKQLDEKSSASAQKNLSVEKLSDFYIPIPSLAKQQQIVSHLDQLTENNNKLLQHYQNKLQALQRLKNSVLESAFKGEFNKDNVLVLVDPYIERNKQLSAKKNADKQAMVIALSIEAHNKLGKSLYRTKGEKTVELIEKHIGLEFGREAKKLAAGPASFQHLVKVVEPLAKTHKWFNVQEIKGDNFDSHKYIKGDNFNPFLLRAVKELQSNLPEIRRVISLFANLKTTHEAEVYATTYAGWNNLIIRKLNPDDEAIVTEARENWHEAKLKIERSEFFDAIKWLRNNNLVPKGNGKEVN